MNGLKSALGPRRPATMRGKWRLLIAHCVAAALGSGLSIVGFLLDASTPLAAEDSLAGEARPDMLKPLEQWRRMRGIEPRHYVARKASSPLTIDGRLDEPIWQSSPPSEPFVDISANPALAPKHATRMKLCWDDEYLYIGAEIDEPHVWATIVDHDEVIFRDPDFEVFIDPDSDNHDYYEFEMNALNTGWDLRLVKPYRDGGPALNEWEIPGLKTAVAVRGTLNDPSDRDQGWSVELAFPWRALVEFAHRPAPPADGDQWRIDFSRVEWKISIENGRYVKAPNTPEDNWVWSPTGIIDMHRPEKWGFVQFSSATTGDVAFRPDPGAPARRLLHAVYYCQQDFHDRFDRWASNLDELQRDTRCAAVLADEPDSLRSTLQLRSTADGYTASVLPAWPAGANAGARIEIRQDSRIQLSH